MYYTRENSEKILQLTYNEYNTDAAQGIAEKSVSWDWIFIIYGGGLEWEWLP